MEKVFSYKSGEYAIEVEMPKASGMLGKLLFRGYEERKHKTTGEITTTAKFLLDDADEMLEVIVLDTPNADIKKNEIVDLVDFKMTVGTQDRVFRGQPSGAKPVARFNAKSVVKVNANVNGQQGK